MSRWVLVAAVGLVVLAAAAWLVATLAERRRRDLRARLTAVMAAPGRDADAPSAGWVSLRRALPSGAQGGFSLFSGRFYRWLGEELGATGDRLKTSNLLVAAAIGAVLAAGVLDGLLRLPFVVTVPLVLAAGVAAGNARLRGAQRRFQRQFVAGFPDALDVLVRAVRAGLPVLDAMESAADTVADPVASEFRRVLDELRIGLDLDDLLERAANRIRVNDFRFFAATLVLQRRTGGSLGETLSNLAGLIRRRKEVRLKARSLSAESRASAAVIGTLPLVMGGVMYLINPRMGSLLVTDPRGQMILGIAIFLHLSGFALMFAMIKKASQ
jgi:tight adherence protein B